MAYKKGSRAAGGAAKVFASVQAQLAECQLQGLVPADFIPQGSTEREQYTSLSSRATVGWHEQRGPGYRSADYVPRSERKLWGGPEPPQETYQPPPIEKLVAEVARALPRGDAWEDDDSPPAAE